MGDVILFPVRGTTAPARRRPLLWREAVGHELRRERLAQGRTQGDVAEAGGISTQYLSEIERGRKEASSEILQAAAGALGLDLHDLAGRVAEQAATADRPTGPVLLAA